MVSNYNLIEIADPYAASVSAALSSMNINTGASTSGASGASNNENVSPAAQAPVAAANATMNNGQKDKTHSDVQKLQQQLNDIKEQVIKN